MALSKWEKVACLIAAVIVFIIVQRWFNQIERMTEAEHHVYEVARQEREQFDKLISYCKENETIYMKLSEQVFGYLDEGLSIEEIRTYMEENATSEQKEILNETLLSIPSDNGIEDSIFKELLGKGIYYMGLGRRIKVVYIHEYNKETEEYIFSREYTTTEKINDHLYVCYTDIPYT